MNTPVLIAILAAVIVVLLLVHSRKSDRRHSRHRVSRGATSRPQGRSTAMKQRRPEAPYVSASLRGVSQDPIGKSRRTSGLG